VPPRGYRETHKNIAAEYMRNYRKRKAQENKTLQASTSTDPIPIPIIYNCNQAKIFFSELLDLILALIWSLDEMWMVYHA
jgi:hypothetical protein